MLNGFGNDVCLYFLQGQNSNQLSTVIRNLQYQPGSRGSSNIQDALQQARQSQLTPNNGARLGVPNIILILTSTRDPLSSGVSHRSITVVTSKQVKLEFMHCVRMKSWRRNELL